MTVRKIEDILLVTFSDDGVPFDVLQECGTSPEDKASNLAVLKAVSEKIECGRVVGMNKTDITLR